MKFTFARRLVPGKTWLMLGIALATGLLAALLARNYLAGQMAAMQAMGRNGQVEVLVAKRDLKPGEPLNADTVAVRPMPADYVHASALRPQDFDALEGSPLTQGLRPGEAILKTMLQAKAPPTFSARVSAGRRAVTVPVDEINSISGLLEPGDVVDLMLTMDQDGRKLTAPLLQKVSVMATGQRAMADPGSGERRQYSTVTLDISPQQARTLIAARDAGKLTALLRNPADKLASVSDEREMAMLLALVSGHAHNAVPVLYGGRSAKIPPEGLSLGKPAMSALEVLPEPETAPQPSSAAMAPGSRASPASSRTP